MSVSNVSTPRGSPSLAVLVEEDGYEVLVGANFSWDDLTQVLNGYIERIEDVWEGHDEPANVTEFVEGLMEWLKSSDSMELDAKQSLRDWKVKSENVKGLPEFLIHED